MKISGINSSYNINSAHNKNQQNSISFGAYRSVFSKQLDDVLLKGKLDDGDAERLTGLFNKFLKRFQSLNRLLGTGFHGNVYKIDDKYVVKIPRVRACIFDFENINQQKFKALKTYYGEPVANFKHAKVLKNVSSKGSHMQTGVPGNMFGRYLPEEYAAYYDQTYLPHFASVPQRAFDAIAKDLDTLNKMGHGVNNYTFDFKNPNNFVLVGNTLRITDVIVETSIKNPNTMAEMLDVFLHKMNLNINASYSKVAEAPRRELLRKIILAGMKYNLNIGDVSSDKIIWRQIIEDLCRLNVSGEDVVSYLAELQKNVPDTKLRLKLTKEYLDDICKDVSY